MERLNQLLLLRRVPCCRFLLRLGCVEVVLPMYERSYFVRVLPEYQDTVRGGWSCWLGPSSHVSPEVGGLARFGGLFVRVVDSGLWYG